MQWRECGRTGAVQLASDAPAFAAVAYRPREQPALAVDRIERRLEPDLIVFHRNELVAAVDRPAVGHEIERPAAGRAAGRRGIVGNLGPIGQRLGQPVQEAHPVREGTLRSVQFKHDAFDHFCLGSQLLFFIFCIQDLVRKGVPQPFRGLVWQLLSNAQTNPVRDRYSELLRQESPCEKIIKRDIARTFPEHDFFRDKNGAGQKGSLSFIPTIFH